ncbi:17608_t:CDS:2, partial [Cetraspora pellucida]
LNISEPEFDADYSTGEEDPREEKKKLNISRVKKGLLPKLPEIPKIPTAELIPVDEDKDSQ